MSIDSIAKEFHFRRFVPDTDLSQLVLLLNAAEAVDHSGEDLSEEALRDQLTWPGHDPLLDRWVVEAPDDQGQLIGFSSVWKPPSIEHAYFTAVVHPSWRRRGIGSDLLIRSIVRSKELSATQVLVYADVSHLAANAFLRKRGFWPVASYTQMELKADIHLDTPAWTAGYAVRNYNTIQHFPTLLHALNRSYQGLWGQHWLTDEDLANELPNLTLDGTFLLYAPGDEVVGFCRAEISDQLSVRRGKRTGYIDSPEVVPEHRGDGLYLPLLLYAAQWVRTQELVDIELESWGDDEQTIALYQKAGFSIVKKEAIYKWDLS